MTTRDCDVTWKRKDESFVENVFPVLSRRFSPQISLFLRLPIALVNTSNDALSFFFSQEPNFDQFRNF